VVDVDLSPLLLLRFFQFSSGRYTVAALTARTLQVPERMEDGRAASIFPGI